MPIGNALQDILQTSIPAGYKRAAELEKNQLENQYYGPVQMANIASKNTYAQYLPSQIIGQVLANPLAWQTMDKNQLRALTQQYTRSLTNPPSVRSLSQMPEAKNGLLSMLFNKLGGGEQAAPQQSQNAMSSMSGMPSDNGEASNENMSGGGQGNALMSPPASPGGLPSTTINRVAPNYQVGGYGGVNPLTAAKAQAAGLETTATSEAGNQSKQWNDLITSAGESAESAQGDINIADKLAEAYPKLKNWEKGPVAGKFPAFTEAASDIDKAQSALADSVARAQQSGHITQADRATYGSMKPTRDQPGKAFEHQLSFVRGMAERRQEKPAFLQRSQELNLSPSQANSVWSYYIHQRPFYDSKNNRVNEKNMNTWEEFLTPKKFQEAMNPSLRPKSSRKSDSQIIRVRSPNGRTASGPAEKIDAFLKDHSDWQRI